MCSFSGFSLFFSLFSLVCPECKQSLVNSARLERHLPVHQVFRAYLCPLCGKTYKYEYNLFFCWRRTCQYLNELVRVEEQKSFNYLVHSLASQRMIFLTLLKKGETHPKVAKAFSELRQTEALSKEINNELLESLPAAYDNRITFCVNTLQTLFNTHNIYQSECSKSWRIYQHTRVPRPEPRPDTPTDSVADISSHRSTPSPVYAPPPATPASLADSAANQPNASSGGNPFEEGNVEEVFENKIYPLAAVPPRADKEKEDNTNENPKKVKDPTNSFEGDTDEEQHEQAWSVGGAIEAPSTDHALEVLESEREDQVDEGWQLSEKADGTRGVFPGNFTRRLD